MFLTFSDVSFAYDESPVDALQHITVTFAEGWSAIVGANGQGKTTLLRLAAGELAPTGGDISRPGDTVYCPQHTDTLPDLLDEFALDWGADAGYLRSVLDIGEDWPWRFHTLSHGERKRLQLAVALWRRPHVLAVDEPTNHLDAPARALVFDALRSFRGIGLLVSHDRELLDGLAQQCLFLGGRGPELVPGAYTAAKAQLNLQIESQARERASAKRELQRLRSVAAARRTSADAAHAKRSRGRIDPKDKDAKGRVNLAIFTGKDGQAGRLSAQMEGRVQRAEERLANTWAEDTSDGGGIWLPAGRSHRKMVAYVLPQLVPMGEGRFLELPELAVGPTDRIALVGPNGVGKSTLIRTLLDSVQVDDSRVLYIPQELEIGETERLSREFGDLPEAMLGRVLSVVARLGSTPDRMLASDRLSPGEVRKLMLAMGVLAEPHLIVMDEPTNHLDLQSTEALEAALSACPCALVLVSHDKRFVDSLATIQWRLARGDDGVTRVEVTQG